jgi:hypothetical protein
MKRLVGLSLLGLFLVSVAGPASAWEFKLKGRFNFDYQYLSQYNDHFFGPADIDASPPNNAQQINFWPGLNQPKVNSGSFANGPGGRTVSGSDAGWLTQWAELYPQIKINKAITWQALIYLGSWDFTPVMEGQDRAAIPELVKSEYPNSTRRGIWRSMTPFYVNYWRMSVKLPWGSLSLGKRPSGFGIGLMNSGKHDILKTSDTTSNSVALTAPLGPLLIGISFYPNRWGPEGYYNADADRTNIRWANFAWGATYRAGDLMTGFAIGHAFRHRGGERTIGTASSSRERDDLDAGWFMKYNNGRFFFNAEFRWYDRIDRWTRQNWQANNGRLYFDQEVRAWAVEGGWIAGPTKTSVLVVDVSGPDRRAYSVWGNSSTFKTNTILSISDNYSNGTLLFPYSYLLTHTYGSGTLPDQEGNGYFEAGRFYGARIDYAVACNLNVYLSYCEAKRAYKGFGWGYLRVDAGGFVRYGALDPGPGPNDRSPAIPDDDLGREVGVGLDWQLLEGFTMHSRLAYFQPGRWWSYACVSKTNPLWRTPADDRVLWGTNPARTIDPVVGGYIIWSFDF